MSRYYSTVKKYYDLGIYSKEKVAQFVEKSLITAEEYELITGEAYQA